MGELDVGQAIRTDLKGEFQPGTELAFEVPSQVTDGPGDQKETEYINQDWSKQFGYFNTIPELNTAIVTKATWAIGKGFIADEQTEMLLDTFKGYGNDTFNTILKNGITVREIGGDSFTEIIRDENDQMINLKPLDPGTMKIIVNRKGILMRYEKVEKVGSKRVVQKFEPDEIFHLSRNRIADEIHGRSVIDVCENIIKFRNQAMADWDRVLHRNVDPLWLVEVDTDNATKLQGIRDTLQQARGRGESIVLPKGTVTMEMVTVAQNATLNPLPWIEQLNDYFYEAVGVPKVIIGNSKNFTDASSKIVYVSYEQRILAEQLYIVEQVLAQLNLVIKLPRPASLVGDALSEEPAQDELQANAPEAEGAEQALQPKDKTAELQGGRK